MLEIIWLFTWTLILLGLIVLACSVFTNGIEWVGHRFELSEGAVGSVLAAVGTALPETLVPIVAIVSGVMGLSGLDAKAGHEIGVGAILGAPFLLSTLAMFISALAVIFFARKRKRTLEMTFNEHLFKRDLRYFFGSFGIMLLASQIPSPLVKHILAVILLVFYGVYVYRTMTKEHVPDAEFDMEPLMLAPRRLEPPTSLILIQTFLGLAGIMVLAHAFVDQLQHLSTTFHIDALVLSLIITPIATELPEKFNSVVWLSKKRDSLAMGNLTGAMVFQSCIPGAIGLAFTPWVFSTQAGLSAILTLLSALTLYFVGFLNREKTVYVLLAGGLFYAIFIIYSLFLMGDTSVFHAA